MAYVSKEKKAKIKAALDGLKKAGVIPTDWRWTLSVDNGRAIVFTVWEANDDLVALLGDPGRPSLNLSISRYWSDYYAAKADERTNAAFRAIIEALNIDNWDRSDIMTDYFDVGHYVYIRLGRWDKPFRTLGTKEVVYA